MIALLFVTLPFVVRSVQPVLIEVDREAEEAAASLGAGNLVIFRRVVLPALIPALLSGAGLAFARAVGEFGSVVLIGGGIPRDTEVASQYIAKQIEIDRPETAAAVSLVLLIIAFAVLVGFRLLAARSPAPRARIAMDISQPTRISLRVARARLPDRAAHGAARDDLLPHLRGRLRGVLGAGDHAGEHLGDQPLADHRGHRRAAQRGLRRDHARWRSRAAASADAASSRRSSTSRSPSRRWWWASSLILLWGVDGWLGGLAEHGVRIIFSLPGMVIATIFVTLPFVVREVEPVLHEIGDEQEQAAATLGASWRADVQAHHAAVDPLGPAYGVVLTVARSLGEFGALIVVAGGVSGESQTLTLLVHARYIDDHNTFGAYAAATVLMGLAILTLFLMTMLNRKREST